MTETLKPGTRFRLVYAAQGYAAPVGTRYTVRSLEGAGLVCVTDEGNPAFIPTTCRFPVNWTGNGFQINRIGKPEALAVYEIIE